MAPPLLGIHHMTAITGPPQQTLNFYRHVLGMRLVKVTVNYDDPNTYHLYFGDEAGRPGTLLTFFPQPESRDGRAGAGQVIVTSLAVRSGSLASWRSHFAGLGVESRIEVGDDRDYLRIRDPDGLVYDLIELSGDEEAAGSADDDVGGAKGTIQSLAGVTFLVSEPQRSATFFRETLGLETVQTDEDRHRVMFGAGDSSEVIELVRDDTNERGRFGPGTVHHIAFRISDGAAQREWLEILRETGLNVTDVRERQYFTSIYFREPGGVIIEIATDSPGMMIDESADALGSALRLPPWLEGDRSAIERRLPRIDWS